MLSSSGKDTPNLMDPLRSSYSQPLVLQEPSTGLDKPLRPERVHRQKQEGATEKLKTTTRLNTTNTIRREKCESSSDQTYYLDLSLLIRGYQVVGILVLGRLMEFCKQDM